jgi:probable phosphoglycerate mutase
MAGCGRGRVIAHPASAGFCSPQVKLTTPLRALIARWIGLSAGSGQHFLLDTGTLCVLGYYRDIPAVKVWNGPLIE